MTDAALRAAAKALLECGLGIKGDYEEVVGRMEAILRRRMEPKWTRSKPTEPGWWWWRADDLGPRIIILATWDGVVRVPATFDRADAEWSGPLPPPAYEGERDADHD